jgi:LPS-assembly protein
MRQLALVFALFLCAVMAQAQEPRLRPPAHTPFDRSAPVTISADRIKGYANREASASGNAELHQDDLSIYADRLRYFYDTDEVEAAGGVRVVRPGDRLNGTGLRLRVHDNIGRIDHAEYEFKRPSRSGFAPVTSRGTADVIKLEGKDKYHLKNATLTTCKPGNNDWYMQAGELDVDMARNLGEARKAKLMFKNVPIGYLPWVDFPLNDERKTGFLPPTLGSSGKSGIEASVPFYINLAPNRDLTLTPRELSKRGLQLAVDFRYLERSYNGEFRIEDLSNDRVANANRYAITLQHNQKFSGDLTGTVNINRVSDDSYFRDLGSSINITSQIELPREGVLTYRGDWGTATARVQRFQTLQDPSSPIIPPYDRLPQLTLTAAHQYLGGLDLGLSSEYVKFDRGGFPAAAGGTNTSATNGSRLTVYPSVSLPLALPGAYLTPKLGFHETRYSLSDTPAGTPNDINRALPIASLDSGLTFQRDTEFRGQQFLQTLEPRLYYLYVPYRDQSKIPLFDTGLADFNYAQIFSENIFDGGDRIADANQLTVAATSRLLSPGSGAEMYKATVGQVYYFKGQQVTLNDNVTPVRNNNTSDLLAALSARITPHWILDSGLLYNQQRNFFDRMNLAVRFEPETAKALNLGYRFTRGSLDQFDVSAQWPLGGGWHGVGRYNYSMRANRVIESLGGFEYNAGCWIGRLVLQRFASAAGTSTSAVFVQLELNGFSRIGSNPIQMLKREIPGYNPADQTRPESQPFDFYE